MTRRLIHSCFLGLALALASAPAITRAQTPGAISQFEAWRYRRETDQSLLDALQRQQKPPELYPGEEGDVGPQSLLLVKPRRTFLEAFGDSQYFYTDNMFLQESQPGSEPVATGELVNTVQLALAPTPVGLGGGRLAPRVGYRHQWFNHGLEQAASTLNDFDFNAPTVFAEAHWQWRERWLFGAGFEWTRLLSTQDYNEFYKDYAPWLGVARLFPVFAQGMFVARYQAMYRFTDTDPRPGRNVNDRLQQTLLASYNHFFFRRLVAQPFYRLDYSHYTHNQGRDDFLHSFGLAWTWFLNDKLSLRAFASYDLRESDAPVVPDYRVLNAGGGLSLVLRF